MNARLKHVLALLLPPIILEIRAQLRQTSVFSGARLPLAATLRAKPEWEAVPDNDAAWTSHEGWSHSSIVETQLEKWHAFMASLASPRPFGVSHEAPPDAPLDIGLHNTVMTFGYALGRALCGRTALSVLDWGGGLGHYFAYARALYPSIAFDYVVKDLKGLCEAGSGLLPQVRFVTDEVAALARQYDFVFASSSLHYTRRLYDLLDKVCASAARYLMVTRLPVVSSHDDFVVVQRPHRYGYRTEYPCWFVNRRRFVDFIEARGLSLDREFLLAERPHVPNAPEQCFYRGFLFERRS